MFLLIHNSLTHASGLCGHLQASVFVTLKTIQICSAIASWDPRSLFHLFRYCTGYARLKYYLKFNKGLMCLYIINVGEILQRC
jgi:hypothetical protein